MKMQSVQILIQKSNNSLTLLEKALVDCKEELLVIQ